MRLLKHANAFYEASKTQSEAGRGPAETQFLTAVLTAARVHFDTHQSP